MTLQLLHTKFPYIWGKFDFFYQCSPWVVEAPEAGAGVEEGGQVVYEDHAAPPTSRGPPEQDLLVCAPLQANFIIN